MNAVSCPFEKRDDVAADYVAERLAAPERDGFELHLLACPECAGAVREALAIRAGFRRRVVRRRMPATGALGVAAAAVLAAIVLQTPAARRLGRVDAPEAGLLEARGSADAAARQAARGIDAYRAGDYRAAADWLGRAQAERSQPGIAYYRGLSLLLQGNADSARLIFEQLIESHSAAYIPEAHYYAAKAWLQLGQIDSARAHLASDAMTREPLRTRAAALLDSIQKFR